MRRNKPYVTYTFLGINTIFFLLEYLVPSLRINERLGMFIPSIILGHEYWRFLTPMIIHFGLMHFVLNSVVLYYMGQQCEAIFGHWRFCLVYLLSGLMGNMGSFAFNGLGVLSGGASTAIFGLFGAFLVIGYHYQDNPAVQGLTRQFGLFILLNLAFGLFDSSIDLWGHLGGLLGGALSGLILGVPNGDERFSIRGRITGGLFFAFFVVIAVLLAFRKIGMPII
ncbi:rhomboid family intramembrane serine protease [Candidatus Enterococcus ferrettii]|uniref:Rhomboid protease GluP n=1 Tax=Candidatus Enterococcus ferrettii TaxID=2815324 RepID=A0ABV0EW10_9ENTE|nr:rhomboid family intramembrane serine protease [Enterococcus sp. 665A]MBO1339943.1 rhomboid family intramembrane serine protease [Enterococcus sp. 665A]